MIKKKIEDATAEELKYYGTVVLGLQMGNSTKRETLITKIEQIYDKDFIEVDEALFADMSGDAPKDPNALAVDVKRNGGTSLNKPFNERSGRNDPVVNLTITAQETVGGDRPVFVGVNGISFMIPRGKPCDVPYRYYLSLKNAIRSDFTQDENDNMIKRDIPVYPFQVNIMPSSESIKQWEAAQGIVHE